MLGVIDPISLGVADPFMLATTSVARVLGGLGRLVFLVYLVLLVFLVQPRSPLTSNLLFLISRSLM